MKVVSVSVGEPVEVPYGGRGNEGARDERARDERARTVRTGIFKRPVAGRVTARHQGLEGDGQADTEDHGGENKAVYAYPVEHYAAFAAELDRDALEPAQFGENLTIAGLLEGDAGIGDVVSIGTAVLQIAQPRKPCFKLGIRLGDATFPKRFLASGRIGLYLRVLEEGELGAGDAIERRRTGGFGLSIADVWRIVFIDKEDVEGARRVLEIPWLAPEFRWPLEKRLAREV